MGNKIIVPALGESVSEATVSKWLKSVGDQVSSDEALVELETDKVSVSVPAPEAGVLSEIIAKEGTSVKVGAILASIEPGTGRSTASKSKVIKENNNVTSSNKTSEAKVEKEFLVSPAARRVVEENKIDINTISGSGKDGRILKEDLLEAMGQSFPPSQSRVSKGEEERVKMTRLRITISKRLKEAQNSAAMLTTFNEVDMSRIIEMRADNKFRFEKRYGVKLGFMSFFVKSCVNALKSFPIINAEVQQDEIVFKNYYNIGVAVGTEKGLVVPVVRDADQLSFADIEKEIIELGDKAKTGKLTIEDLQGGTFTITNGGIYGSMLSTPIINPPQSGVLGMHNIVQRPIVLDGEVVARPIMYIALTYDHRIIDGRDAVSFLVRVKEYLEDPRRLFLNL